MKRGAGAGYGWHSSSWDALEIAGQEACMIDLEPRRLSWRKGLLALRRIE